MAQSHWIYHSQVWYDILFNLLNTNKNIKVQKRINIRCRRWKEWCIYYRWRPFSCISFRPSLHCGVLQDLWWQCFDQNCRCWPSMLFYFSYFLLHVTCKKTWFLLFLIFIFMWCDVMQMCYCDRWLWWEMTVILHQRWWSTAMGLHRPWEMLEGGGFVGNRIWM